MNGLQRYNELEAALKVVEKVKLGLYREANFAMTPALEKVMRVGNYLMKQAGNVMEGLTEDGAEDETLALDKLACAKVAGLTVALLAGTQMSGAEKVEFAVAPAGWESVEGGAL
jgi:hypothetical protein